MEITSDTRTQNLPMINVPVDIGHEIGGPIHSGHIAHLDEGTTTKRSLAMVVIPRILEPWVPCYLPTNRYMNTKNGGSTTNPSGKIIARDT